MMANYLGLSRRRFIAGAIGATAVGALAACGDAAVIRSAPYATNVARNAGGGNPSLGSGATAQATQPTAAMGQGMMNATATPNGPHPPTKDWKTMNQHHEAGVKTFLAQPKTRRGGQPLPFVLQDGIKVFDVTAQVVQWELAPGQLVEAWAYNGTVPAPEIRVTEGAGSASG